ncbi:SH3 domain-containing protein [Phascolomyces articulosus]|uniref:SH3 domain-containing protein n=1 Tax=Phascolomyces articulosus TaxID=60185 RepID=A0AAD5PG05_9FUNG|nr:SH3 domain-containing protein [Phascolomyces articulosus]
MSKVPILCRVQARYPFNSNDPSSLSFEQGDYIEVLTKLDSGWWDGWCNGIRGWFPSNYVETVEDYEHEDDSTIRDSANSLSKEKQQRSLPPQWTLQLTEDGTDCYYYNTTTGEMRSTHPDDASESELEDGLSYANGSIDDDDYDFKSVDSRLPWDDSPLPPPPPPQQPTTISQQTTLDRLDNLSNSEKVSYLG